VRILAEDARRFAAELSVTGVRFSAADRITSRPTAVEPV